MLTDKDDFGEDYKQCRDVFVYMGDGTPVAVQGYGTGRIKMDGKVQVLKKSLHVPTLDCSLSMGAAERAVHSLSKMETCT
jgi:hypothetical protein